MTHLLPKACSITAQTAGAKRPQKMPQGRPGQPAMTARSQVAVTSLSGDMLAELSDVGAMTVRELVQHAASTAPPPDGMTYIIISCDASILPSDTLLSEVLEETAGPLELKAVAIKSFVVGEYSYEPPPRPFGSGLWVTSLRLTLMSDMKVHCEACRGLTVRGVLHMRAVGTWEQSASQVLVTLNACQSSTVRRGQEAHWESIELFDVRIQLGVEGEKLYIVGVAQEGNEDEVYMEEWWRLLTDARLITKTNHYINPSSN